MQKNFLFVAAASMVLLHAISAVAQPAVQLNAFCSAELATDGFAVSRPDDLGHLHLAAKLSLDYAHEPLVVAQNGGGITRVVEHRLTANLGVGLGLFDALVLYGGLPVNLVMDGTRVASVPAADGFGLSDAWAGARLRLWGAQHDVFAVAVQATVTFPVADYARASQRYSGDIGMTVTPKLLLELRLPESIRITLNGGARLRGEDQAAVVSTLPISHELVWAAGFRCLLCSLDRIAIAPKC